MEARIFLQEHVRKRLSTTTGGGKVVGFGKCDFIRRLFVVRVLGDGFLSRYRLSKTGFRNAVHIQRVRAEILTVLPLHTAQEGFDRVEEAHVFQLLEYPYVQIGFHIKAFYFAIGENQSDCIVGIRFDCLNSGIHKRPLLFQRFNPEDVLPLTGKFPVGHQFVLMNFYPCLHQFQSACL
jgi:hypothetical protein